MMRSLNSGVSGVQSHQIMMDVVGNNVANVNTIGFKSSRANFADAISQILRPGQGSLTNRGTVNPVQVGLGVQLQSISNNFNQGSLESTGYATDLALLGDGFFMVQGGDTTYFTRAGNFTLDAEGNMIAGNGIGTVLGRMANEDGVIENSALTGLQIPLSRKIPAQSTTEVEVYSNLDADATDSEASLVDAGTTGVTSVAGTATDGLGGTHEVTITGANATNSTLGSTLTGFNMDTLLADLAGAGLTNVDELTIIVDDGSSHESTVNITGLDNESTVGDLITQINAQVSGVEFEYDTQAQQINVTRTYAGDGNEYNVRMLDAGTSSVISDLFGAADVTVNSGIASTLVATDVFTDAATGTQLTTTLDFDPDPATGLMTTMTDLGRGGVSIVAADGFVAGTMVVDTEATDHTTSISVYDEKGAMHNLSITFTKTANLNEWKWEADVDEPSVTVGGSSGIVSFNSDGSFRNWVYDDGGDNFSFDPGDGTNSVSLAFNAGDFDGMNGITQTAAAFSTTLVNQNGYAMGTLSDIDINYDGRIMGNFTNGQEMLIGEMVLADFSNTDGLEKAGNNMWLATEVSGDPVLGNAESDFGSTIESGKLEMSNVDLVDEFTDMIKAQRGFQANSRVITVSDQILQEVTNLKR